MAKLNPKEFGDVCRRALEMLEAGSTLGEANRLIMVESGNALRYRNRYDFDQMLREYKRIGDKWHVWWKSTNS